jgi:hypothetical protein
MASGTANVDWDVLAALTVTVGNRVPVESAAESGTGSWAPMIVAAEQQVAINEKTTKRRFIRKKLTGMQNGHEPKSVPVLLVGRANQRRPLRT